MLFFPLRRHGFPETGVPFLDPLFSPLAHRFPFSGVCVAWMRDGRGCADPLLIYGDCRDVLGFPAPRSDRLSIGSPPLFFRRDMAEEARLRCPRAPFSRSESKATHFSHGLVRVRKLLASHPGYPGDCKLPGGALLSYRQQRH